MTGPVRCKPLMAMALVLGLATSANSVGAAKPAAPPASAASAPKAHPPAKQPAPIDVNSASRAQLKTLPGIGDAEAGRIIAGRPYHSKADLVERGIIPTGVYVSLKGRIIAKQKSKGGVGVP